MGKPKKGKKNRTEDDWSDKEDVELDHGIILNGNEEEESIVAVKKNKKAKKNTKVLQLLNDDDDDDNENEKDDFDDDPPTNTVKKSMSAFSMLNDDEDDDNDNASPPEEIEEAPKPDKKKKKKEKSKLEAIDDSEDVPASESQSKKKKKKKGKEKEKDEDDDLDAILAEMGIKSAEPSTELEAKEEEKARKKREKKERQKKEKEQQIKKQDEPKPAEEPKPEETEDKEKSKKKKKDKKKKEEKKEEEPKKKVSAQVKAILELQEKKRLEEERIKKEAEEGERRLEEALRLKEEQDKKAAEKKEKQKLKEKLKRERQKANRKGKVSERALASFGITGKEKENQEEEPVKRKKPVYTKKKKPQQTPTEEKLPVITATFVEEPEDKIASEEKEESPEIEPSEKPIEKEKEEDEDVKENWAESSDDEGPHSQSENVAKRQVKITEQKSVDQHDESSDEYSDDSSEEEESSDEDWDDDAMNGMTPVERGKERIKRKHFYFEDKRTTDVLRAPVVCVLGHVDTGKTKILDKLRKTNVQLGEAGGITQQIGATNVPKAAILEKTKMCKNFTKQELRLPGLLIIDTPGHESFSNLRDRGSSLCDVAVLVVDIMHGLEPQTLESIELLKKKKTPFVIALNKIDRLYEWRPNPNSDVVNTLAKMQTHTKHEFEERWNHSYVQLMEQGLNIALFHENKNPEEYISVVPTSAHSGDGMGNLLASICELGQNQIPKELAVSEELCASVMEVKEQHGLGTTLDVILLQGQLKEGDTIVLAGSDGPIVTQIRGLLMPQPLKELRIKSSYERHKVVNAAQGVKIIAKELDKAMAGLPLYSTKNPDEIEYYKSHLSKMLQEVLSEIKLSERGVYVQASTLGSMEALLKFFRDSKIPYAGINIGPLHKRDVVKASTMLEHDAQWACILAFDVKVEREAQELADSVGVKIFTADIIYHLYDSFNKYLDDLKKKRREELKDTVVFPSKLKIMPQYIFNKRDPIVIGVTVEAGCLKVGTPICVPAKEFCELGRVASIEKSHNNVDSAKKGDEVCIKIEPLPGVAPRLFGRHFDAEDMLVSKISRESIDALKECFREEMQKSDWVLIVELKKVFSII